MTISNVAGKSADAFRTISEVAEALKLPQHVLRFWETRFTQIKPLKRAGGRRFYRPEDVELLGSIRQLLYGEGYTIKGVQRILREQGPRAVAALARHHQEGGGPVQPPFDPAAGWGGEEPTPEEIEPDETTGSELPGAPAEPHDAGQAHPAPLPWMVDQAAAPAAREAADGGVAEELRAVLAEIEACRRLLASARA